MNMQEIKQQIGKIDASIQRGKGIIENVTKEVQQLILNKQELIGYANALADIEKGKAKTNKPVKGLTKELVKKVKK